jgi:hypothetical protein
MSSFAGMLATREGVDLQIDQFNGTLTYFACEDQISGDVFDTLESFTDFNEFKELALSYKAEEIIECKYLV